VTPAAAALALIVVLSSLLSGDGASAARDGTASAPAQASVALTVDSHPRGAEVWDLTSGARLGATPLARTTPRSEARHTIEVRKAGYTSARWSLILRQDTSLSFSLAAFEPEVRSVREATGESSAPLPEVRPNVRHHRAAPSKTRSPASNEGIPPPSAPDASRRRDVMDPFAKRTVRLD
jgi:hypothetical protein